jgi:hypothetical protein
VRQRILVAGHAVAYASSSANARSHSGAGARTGSRTDSDASTIPFTVPISIAVPVTATEFLERSVAIANVWQSPCLSGDASINGLVREQRHWNAGGDLCGCAVFLFDGIRNVLGEWRRLLLEELTVA